jgi:hypothetical protein
MANTIDKLELQLLKQTNYLLGFVSQNMCSNP